MQTVFIVAEKVRAFSFQNWLLTSWEKQMGRHGKASFEKSKIVFMVYVYGFSCFYVNIMLFICSDLGFFY